MATQLSITQIACMEGIAAFNQDSVFFKTCRMEYNKDFENSGYRSGNSVNVRLPTIPGPSNVGNNVNLQGIVENQVPVTIYQWNQAFSLTLNQMTTALTNSDLAGRAMEPTTNRLVRDMEQFNMKVAAFQASNVINTPGTTVASNQLFANMRAQLKGQLIPSDKLFGAITFDVESALFGSNQSLYNPAKFIGDSFTTGVVRNSAGVDIYSSANVPRITTIAAGGIGTPVSGTITGSGTILQITGMVASVVIPSGTKFTIAGVNAVDPQTKQDLGYLQVFSAYSGFTVSADPTVLPTFNSFTASAGTASVTITPAILGSTSGGQQTVTAVPSPGAAIVFVGQSASGSAAQTRGSYSANIVYNDNAFVLASIPMELPIQPGIGKRVTDKTSGLSMISNGSYIFQSTTNAFSISCLLGLAVPRYNWAGIVAGV